MEARKVNLQVTNYQEQELKQKLLDCLRANKAAIQKATEELHAKEELQDQDRIEYCQTVIKLANDIIAAGDWQRTLFLRNTIKPLKKLKQDAENLLGDLTGLTVQEQAIQKKDLTDCELVYVSLFQSQGHQLQNWEAQLSSINRYVLGRPVYKEEQHAAKVIRMKMAQATEAYAVVAVPKTALQHDFLQAPRKDRYGNELVQLAPNCVKTENIVEFVHAGKRYYFHEGKLIPKLEKK